MLCSVCRRSRTTVSAVAPATGRPSWPFHHPCMQRMHPLSHCCPECRSRPPHLHILLAKAMCLLAALLLLGSRAMHRAELPRRTGLGLGGWKNAGWPPHTAHRAADAGRQAPARPAAWPASSITSGSQVLGCQQKLCGLAGPQDTLTCASASSTCEELASTWRQAWHV